MNIYVEALVHRSARDTHQVSQERLEHLGDAVLSLCVTHILFKKYPTAAEGELSGMRANLVNGVSLARAARAMNVSSLVAVSGEHASHILASDRLHEDTFEALVGAVYLDLGLQKAFDFVSYHLEAAMQHAVEADNPKNELRRILQRLGMQAPYYDVQNMDGVTRVRVYTGDVLLAEADGSNRKRAEAEAARLAAGVMQA